MARKVLQDASLREVWDRAIREFRPGALLAARPAARAADDEAVLLWGKAARSTWEALRPGRVSGAAPALVISPSSSPAADQAASRMTLTEGAFQIRGEHPLPGPGSFEAGQAILEFLDSLRRLGVRRLRVYLSGGASSLAWLRPASVSRDRLLSELSRLYASAITIEEMNRRRARLCALKGGGTARWLERLSPRTRAQVEVISDVHPYPVSTVGSGPFWNGRVPHRVLADNPALVAAVLREARTAGFPILRSQPVPPDWRSWVRGIVTRVHRAFQQAEQGLLVWGGEPILRLPRSARGRGGRQTHCAAALALALAEPLAERRLELLCMSSDGLDGASGASGVLLGPSQGQALRNERSRQRQRLRRALFDFDSASALDALDALLPSRPSETNVQDIVIARIRSASN